MDINIINDIKAIFKNNLNDYLIDDIVEMLETILQKYPDALEIKTRNKNNDLLPYFSLIYKIQKVPAITVGSIERNEKGMRVPAMRFRTNNKHFSKISNVYLFEYRRPTWKNIEINKDTIGYIPILIKAEIEDYFLNLKNKKNKVHINGNLSSTDENKQDYTVPVLVSLMIIAAIMFIISFSIDPLSKYYLWVTIPSILIFAGSSILLLLILIDEGKINVDYYTSAKQSSNVTCPRCGSEQITANQRGFKTGRAVVGGLLTGIIGGLIAGGIGKNKVIITCLKCGREWRP